jgi:hypothetical protein
MTTLPSTGDTPQVMLPTVTYALLRTPCLQHMLNSNINYGKIVNDKLTATRRNLVRLVLLRLNVLEEENVKETPIGLTGNRWPGQPSSPTRSIFRSRSQYHEYIYKRSIITK